MLTLFHTRVSAFHILLTLFFVFAWTRAIQQYRHRLMSGIGLAFWTIVWGGATYLLYLPNRASLFAQLLGVQSGANAVFTIATVVLFYSIYRIYAKLEQLQHDINRLNQAASIAHSRQTVGGKIITRKRS